jgi:hypothetical protein
MTPPFKAVPLTLTTITIALLGAPGCRLVSGIFRAGVWMGIVVLLVLAAIVFGIARLFARS